jgi:predicted ATPase/class 3 adenylate cyclase
MAQLPAGTVTFLFTDIERSTQRLLQLGSERYAMLQAEHQRLVRAACAAHGGVEVDTQGDAFFVAFPTAPGALAAAIEAQRTLAATQSFPDGLPLPVRMGLHTGTPLLVGDHYIGLDVVRAARIAAAGHGGQVLLSQTTRDLATHALPPGATLRDMGAHRLKDLQEPEPLFQLVVAGLPADFPPLRTLDTYQHNLPLQPTPFVGRTEELASIAELLVDPACRLVTLVGPGGIGKTRLALQAAEQQIGQFEHGVFFVSLAPISSPGVLASTIANAIQFVFHGMEAPDAQLVNHVRKKQLLLLLDNFDHLLDGSALVHDILQAGPSVKILTTSREPLNLSSETVFNVRGMDFPDWETPQDAWQYSTVKLFMQSARRAQSGFQLQADDLQYVARICRSVEGMPLGILLAASWIETLSPREIAAEIDQSLDFLETEMRDLPIRHRSIRALFDTSWNRLTDVERGVFMKLSVFRGGFTREAAQAAPGASLKTLASLVNKSLLRRDPTGRYDIHELLRQYAEQQLEALPPERANAHHQHCLYYADFMERQWPHLRSRRVKEAKDEIEIDFENVRTAWRRMTQNNKVAEIRKVEKSLLEFLDVHSWHQEGVELFGQAVEALRASSGKDRERDIALGFALQAQGRFYTRLGLLDKGKARAEEGVDLLRGQDCPEEMMMALASLSFACFFPNEWIQVERSSQEGLQIAQAHANPPGIAQHSLFLGWAAANQGNYQEASRLAKAILKNIETAESLSWSWPLYGILAGIAARRMGDYDEAKRQTQANIDLAREIGSSFFIGLSYAFLARVNLLRGEIEEAKRHIQTSVKIFQELDLQFEILRAFDAIAGLLAAHGRPERAVELLTFFLKDPSLSLDVDRVDPERLLATLRAELLPEVFAAAVERGQTLDVDPVIDELLAE